MIVAVSGSRGLNIDMEKYMPIGTTKVITGGAKGVDACAEKYAKEHGLELEIIRPDYKNYYPKVAPLMRNKTIVEKSDVLVAIWDGKSKGTKYTIDYAKKLGKQVFVHIIEVKTSNEDVHEAT